MGRLRCCLVCGLVLLPPWWPGNLTGAYYCMRHGAVPDRWAE